ncbi:MAG: amino acid-binding protein [bacterium]
MSISQLSVFVENKAGHLADVLVSLADGGVNVLSFTIADTTDYGILRLVVDGVERAKDLLSAAQYVVVEHPVVCAVIPDKPGALAAVARLVAESGLDIEYIYLGARDSLLLKTEEMERLERLLADGGFRVLGPGDLL